ncbi:MAG TPA: rhodanese-like domain-containing protein [Egibacteraceae bacterium]|nr:rhodanese-like domain-containing protein [Egibacteraceae bacterium]
MRIVPIVDEGLGNSSYVVDLGDGSAVVIDPFRDPAPYLREAERHGLRLRFAAETHLHADFVSGSRELARHGARVVASAAAPVAFPAELLDDGGELDAGGITVRALGTPGHTPEHLSYLLSDGARPLAVFTGGTLIPGGVARPDLLGPEHTESLARAAYHSVRRLLALPDALPVYPTHGPGSFCSAGGGGKRVSTIGEERAANPLLRAATEEEFVRVLLSGLGSYPHYFRELREVNQAGPAVVGDEPPALRALDPAEAERLVRDGAELVDVRDIEAFARGHVPGSLSIAQRAQFTPWLGWLVRRDRPLVFVGDERTDRRALVWAALSIGYEHLAGELSGGVDAWAASGRALARLPLVEPEAVDARRGIVDVRQADEWQAGHVDGAEHVELGALPERAGALPGEPLVVHCAHGERAMTGASVLARAGHRDVVALRGDPRRLAAALGRGVERA